MPGTAVLGIDTHKHTHVAVAIDSLGRHQGDLQFPATEAGTAALLAWSRQHGAALTASVEGTGSYGYQLTRALQAAGVQVLEVNRPDRANRRRKGKSDPVDAEAAARAVLSGQATAVPKDREGAIEALRALTITRNSAVKATTTAINQIKALLVGAVQHLRDQLLTPSLLQLATRCSQLPSSTGLHAALGSLGRRWLLLHEEVLGLDRRIRDLMRLTAPRLLQRPGVGIHSAAQLLITAGGNPDRLHSDAAFAALCGASPVQVSSGMRQRHRLSRGGDRAANNALWTIANNRMIHDPRTREFAERRRRQGDRATAARTPSASSSATSLARPTPSSARHCSTNPPPSGRLDIGASTPSPRPSTASSRPNSSATGAPGPGSTTSRSPSRSTSTDSTTAACTANSARPTRRIRVPTPQHHPPRAHHPAGAPPLHQTRYLTERAAVGQPPPCRRPQPGRCPRVGADVGGPRGRRADACLGPGRCREGDGARRDRLDLSAARGRWRQRSGCGGQRRGEPALPD